MAAPKDIQDLVERFENNFESYKSAHYNETQVRREFVDPFFEALGWDIDNKQGFAEAYKDVIHEDAIKVGTATRAPDYSFRVGGQRKFFLETKKPSVDIKSDIHPSFQLRRYAWSAKLPLSVLTDFEEFSVYDCRIKPDKADKSSQARVLYLTYKDYLTHWDEIAGIFSKEAILKGSFDKYAEDKKSKRGTAEVDAAFLEEIATWREVLARNIALRNPDLSTKDLNYAVQATVNRIVFLRICEDRGIERHMHLQDLLKGERVYPRLCELFRRADERYNSGIFHFEKEADREDPDILTQAMNIDDKPLKDIIKRLYYPDSPYEFSVLPAEILGQVYEQFLGKVIRLTEGHRAVVEDKPEVKKAGGVKYTPVYIVDYIVRTTVGPMLKGKTPLEVALIRVLDPACGSGSFLIVAYQYLLDWHRDWYIQKLVPLLQSGIKPTSSEIRRLLPNKEAVKGKKGRRREVELPIYQGKSGDWKLTTAERKRILLNNIFGIDIDSQAVEVTKLSLLLKVLEGENEETLEKQLKLFQERALPDLGNNIKCGNSLIGTDIISTDEWQRSEKAEQDRINPFDWEREFPEIMQAGGFNTVIGNPPYIRIQTIKEWAPLEVEYYKEYDSASRGNYDIYVIFVEKGMRLLNQEGRLGFILPHKFFNAKYGQPLRSLISSGMHLSEIVHLGDQQVFNGATTYTCLLFLNKARTSAFRFIRVKDIDAWKSTGYAIEGDIPADSITSNEWNFTIGDDSRIFNKLANMPVKLGQIAHIFVGLQTSADTVFLFKHSNASDAPLTVVRSKELDRSVEIETSLLKHVVRSGEIGRYWAEPTALVLFPYKQDNGKARLISEKDMIDNYPYSWAYLQANYKLLSEREHGKFAGKDWYQLYPKNLDTWEVPKIMLPYMITRLSAFYDKAGYYFVNVTTGGFGITIDESQGTTEYVVGLLNSKLLDWFLKRVSTTFHGGYFAANKQFLVQLPIRTINFSDLADKSRHDQMIHMVEQMLSLNKQLQETRTPHEKTSLQRQIEAIDEQIDRLVYQLYDLTEEEIKIVEGA